MKFLAAFSQSGRLAAALALLLCVGCGLLALPKALEADAKDTVSPRCKVQQTLYYARCGHEVLRRMDAESAWIGRDRQGVERLLLPSERLTSFSASLVSLETTLDLFCPRHVVLMLDEQGEACLWQNFYGFSMECAEPLGMTPQSDEERLLWKRGLAFDSMEEAKRAAEEMENLRENP